MADEGAVVLVGGAAAAAVLGVVGVLELGQRLRGVLDAEEGDARPSLQIAVAAEVGDERVVGVEHEAGAARARGDDLGPVVGEALELAVAVELVAEEVGEHDQARVELVGDARQPRLVDLEQALGPALLEQRGRDSPRHVGAGAVVDRRAARGGEHARDHARGRRLPVRRADDRRALGQRGAEARDRVGREAQQEPPGERRAAAAAASAAERSSGARERDLGAEEGAHAAARTITRSARGRRLTVTGSFAIGSPSA